MATREKESLSLYMSHVVKLPIHCSIMLVVEEIWTFPSIYFATNVRIIQIWSNVGCHDNCELSIWIAVMTMALFWWGYPVT